MTVGRAGEGSGEGIRLVATAIDGFGQKLTIEHRGRTRALRLPLVGEFQIENALVAAGLAIGTGSAADEVFASLEHLEGAKGRLELVGERSGAPFFVDYAHKPDALAKALQALRPYAKRKLVVVFGAGGDRDAGKRPLMGEIAAQNADSVIITDDNPRSENPATIRAAIMEQVGRRGNVLFVNDSKGTNADATARALSSFGDIFWIAGGKPKTGGITSLAEFFPRIRKAYLIGEAAKEFAATLEGKAPYEISETLDVAIPNAARDAAASGIAEPVVLLSPACASFDQYRNFEIRGARFRDLVLALGDVNSVV